MEPQADECPCLSSRRTVGAGIAKLLAFNKVVEGMHQARRHRHGRR